MLQPPTKRYPSVGTTTGQVVFIEQSLKRMLYLK
ncbi:hypothetical protein M2401_003693 [Pseudomonas sp. JUb42]|nr:hypothetical protein [Pseudomonas sp. JUb42]